jgi:trigger factor
MDDEKTASRLVELSPSRRELELKIPAAAVEREYEKILGDYVGRVKVPGFRKGHAPRDMVRSLFDHDVRHDVYDALIPRVLEAELKRLGLKPVNVPGIGRLNREPGGPLRCTASFEVLPDFELPDYHDIKVQAKPVAPEDGDVRKALEDLQAKAAEYLPAEDRAVAEGDYVVVEVQGRDVKTKRLLPVEKTVVLAGHADNEPALNANVTGLKAGQETRFRVTYPPDHPGRRVAGKEIEYTLKAIEIKEKKVPPLNDDFARTVGEYADLEALKAGIRKEIAAAREKSGRNAAAADVLKEIARQVKLELPESMVEQETLSVLKRMLSSQRLPRLTSEALEGLKAQARKQAIDQLTNHLILEKIARQEGVEVTEDDIQGEIRALAEANKVPPATLSAMLEREGRREELRETLLFRKTVDFLAKNAIMT